MPTDPITAVTEVLRRDSRLRHSASDTISYLLDLLYYGEFQIFEQVSSSGAMEFVNLVGVKAPDETREDALWLVSSVSTGAEPSPARWSSTGGDPLKPHVSERTGMIHGLGACSGKVDLVLKILAASRFHRSRLKRPVNIIALFGEEARSTGIRAMLDGRAARPAAAVVGAPTNLELWTHHPGCISLRLEVSRRVRHRRMPPTRGIFELVIPGRSAHAQYPGLGDDALTRGLEVLERLRAAGDVRVLIIDAGEAANRVPARCLLCVATSYETLPPLPDDVETRPMDDGVALPFPVDPLLDGWLTARAAAAEAVAGLLRTESNETAARPRIAMHTGWLASGRDSVIGLITYWTGPGVATRDVGEAFAAAVQQALVGRDEIEVAIQVTQDRPALAEVADRGAGSLLSAAGDSLRVAGVPPVVTGGIITSDAALLAEAGAETVVFGPGRWGADLYRDDEGVPLEHIRAAYRFYEDLVARWCLA